LLEKKYGVKAAGGQGSLKGKIIRIAHMGYVDPLDLVGIVAALEWSLTELGHKVEPGKAVAVTTRILGEELAKGS
jgi:aspartate aminotransferase-like enzyme